MKLERLKNPLVLLAMSAPLLALSACGNVVSLEDDEEDLSVADMRMPARDMLFIPDDGPAREDMAPDLPALDMQTSTPDMALDMGVEPDMAQPPLPSLYPADQTLWPMTPYGVDRLKAIMALKPREASVFAKIGDSNTVNTNFLHCFAGQSVNLGDYNALATTHQAFRAGQAGATTPFDRISLAATVGWSASGALAGNPSPLRKELDAINPRFAFVQFGTNDIQSRNIFSYADQMTEIVETLVTDGVIPILTSIAPRADDAAADAWVPRYNAVMRGLAQARQLPFLDLHREMVKLPAQGLGSDRLHLNAYTQGARACELTSTGLMYGQNMRNLLSLQALDRLRATLLDGQPAPTAQAPLTLSGLGTHEQPYIIPGLPFTDARDTRSQGVSMLDRYTGCSANQDESGPEIVYELKLDAPTKLRAMAFDQGSVDIDLHILDDSLSPAGCLVRDNQDISITLDPGIYYIVLDTYVSSGGVPKPGPYLFTLLQE